MRRITNLRWIALVAVLVLVVGQAAWGQDAESDKARALLKQGEEQYKDLDFKSAQATFLKANELRDRLTDAQKKQLDEYLKKVNDAAKKQAAAMEAYEDGLTALKTNDLEKARDLFEQVAKNEFVPKEVRKDARGQQALAVKRIEDAKAAADAKAATEAKAAADAKAATEAKAAADAKAATDAKAAAEAKAVADAKAASSPKTTTEKTTETPAPAPKPKSDAAAKARLERLQAKINEAKDAIVKGNKALDADKVDEAITCFEQAVKITPQYKPAHERLAFAKGLVGSGGGLAAITRLQKIRNIRKQETELRYTKAMQRSREAVQSPRGKEDFAKATEEVNYAKTLLATNKSLFTSTEYSARKIETEELAKYIEMVKSRWQKEQVSKQSDEIVQSKRRRESDVRRRKIEKIATLKARADTLCDEQKFKQAMDVYGQILKLAPDDAWAKNSYSRLDRFVQILDAKDAYQTSMREEVKQLNDIRWSQVPWHVLMNYPEDWPAITLRRKPIGAGQRTESEADRIVRRRLHQVLPKIELPGVDFKNVVQFLREFGNVSIHVKWAALEQVGVTRETKVDIHLTNVTLEKAIRTILDDVGGVTTLGFVVDGGVITISTKEDLSKQTITRVYDIRDLIIRLPNFEGPNISLRTDTDNDNGSGDNGGWGDDDDDDDDDDDEPTRSEMIEDILGLIRSTIDPTSWRGGESAGDIGSIRELGGQIIVTQTAENQRSLLDLLGQLRESRALQINVEARFITVNSGFLSHVGIDLDFYFNIGSSIARQPGLGGGWAVDPLTGARLTQAGPRLPQWGSGGVWTDKMTPITTGLGSYGFTQGLQSGVNPNIGAIAAGMSGLQIVGSFLDDIQVDFLISATQAHSATRTLTAPRITLYNGQRAYVVVGQQVAYVASLEPVIGENVSAIRPDVQTIGTGTVLDVEGTISADRRYVTMTVRPAVTVLNSIDMFPWGGTGFIQLPNISTQMLECTVSVPDGGTLLLGGQKTAGEVEREMGVPILSKIPVLNRITTNRAKVRDEQTLLILVKPMIIIQREYEEAAFPQ